MEVLTRLLLGNDYPEGSKLASALQKDFQLLREATSPWNAGRESLREDLIAHGIALDAIQTLLLKLIKRSELVFRGQTVDFKLLREAVIEARSGREVAFAELFSESFMEKGQTRESINNYFDYEDGHRAGIR